MDIKRPAEFVGYTFLNYAAKLKRRAKRNNKMAAKAIAARDFTGAEVYLDRAKEAEAELDKLMYSHIVVFNFKEGEQDG